ncbi:hypothetical protein [Desulfobacter hydrogenophilus]|uniref:hypothetical protein n=1 Tax=Desulfobacter hydrogenophilus TaxID=2291 RepID=UPI0013D282E6|nr:hypothetical protein [Desulfobacter hydrogenophilus]NDY73070.1 hypothetical protein [Desulfobacter hydrogenophilus]
MTTEKKRIITAHKGGRTERISQRVLPEVKNMFDEMAERKNMKPADFLEFLIKKVYKKA